MQGEYQLDLELFNLYKKYVMDTNRSDYTIADYFKMKRLQQRLLEVGEEEKAEDVQEILESYK